MIDAEDNLITVLAPARNDLHSETKVVVEVTDLRIMTCHGHIFEIQISKIGGKNSFCSGKNRFFVKFGYEKKVAGEGIEPLQVSNYHPLEGMIGGDRSLEFIYLT